ncbi:hypothetical protein BO94DRAFT_529218 [Aspergillus sclerotioniger CBS 115572]|uniref:Uncharacterized protein n=1 Tax=Aspergillus sclerotioniger CBS 115572 TaxID=1450535 RepID=A0A317UVE6_9EURO|nr:hypothetical protein BO94DRAFT_529218 [Aspergillus sclerotioniger CBS 115572]PWY65379.1 hypothetical protein BO94DRAFT_529218 [Aspergillus sclerotioniger CBS 115572]
MVKQKRKAIALHPASSVATGAPKVGSATAAHIEAKRKEQGKLMVEQSQLAWAKYWAEKAENLAAPFGPLPDNPAAIEAKLERGATIKPVAALKVPQVESVEKSPLSHSAIGNILREAKGHCPKAQAWLKAHEMTKLVKDKMILGVDERDSLRKQVVENLRHRTLVALKAANASKEEVDDTEDVVESGAEAQFQRVLDAHDRLRKALVEFEQMKRQHQSE